MYAHLTTDRLSLRIRGSNQGLVVCKWAARAFPEGKPYLRTGTFPGGRRPQDVVLESMESTNTANELVLRSVPAGDCVPRVRNAASSGLGSAYF